MKRRSDRYCISAPCSAHSSSRRASSDAAAIAQAQGKPQAPRFEVDPFWPKPLPNHWLLGNDDRRARRRAGQRLARPPRRGQPQQRRTRPRAQDLPSAARRRRRCSSSTSPGNLVTVLGRAGPGLRLAGVEPRHLRRSHRQRLDRRQRPGRLAHREVHAGRQVRGAVRQAERAGERQERAGQPDVHRRAATIRTNFGRVAKITVDPKANEAYIADGYLNHRVAVLDAATGKMKRYWGAYGAKPDDTPLGPYDPAAPPGQAVPQPGALRGSRRMTACSTSATASTIASRSSNRMGRSSARCSSRRTPRPRARSGTSRSRRTPSSGSSTSPTARTTGSTSSSATSMRLPHQLRRRRPVSGPVLRRAQHRRRLAGQHLHDRDLRGQTAPEVRVQGPRPGDAGVPGHGLADDQVDTIND